MTQGSRLVTRAPATSRKTDPHRHSHHSMRRHPILPATLTLCALLAACLQARAEEEKRALLDKVLGRSVEAIQEAFRAQRSEFLRPVLRGGGKVYLAVKVVASEAG